MTLVTNLDTAKTGTPTGRYRTSIASFLRSNNATAYTALDVVSDGTGDPSALVFPGCGRSGVIHTVTIANRLEADAVAPRLFLFDAEPTGHADNAALALVTADIPKLIGVVNFDDADKVLVGVLINYWTQTGDSAQNTGNRNMGKIPYTIGKDASTHSLYGLLQTVAGYTPIALTQFTIKLGLEVD